MSLTHGVSPISHEIVELTEIYDPDSRTSENVEKHHSGKGLKKYSIEDDINKLFEAINIGSSLQDLGPHERKSRDNWHKSAMKRPMRLSPLQVVGIGITEPVSLKQALRGLCISQESDESLVMEMGKHEVHQDKLRHFSLSSIFNEESMLVKPLDRGFGFSKQGSRSQIFVKKKTVNETTLASKIRKADSILQNRYGELDIVRVEIQVVVQTLYLVQYPWTLTKTRMTLILVPFGNQRLY